MVHGNPTWSFYYRNIVAALHDSYRTIVPDHIGCGYSDKPDDSRYEYTLRRRVDDLEILLDRLQLKGNITFILHDWGGMIGMAYAARHPERIKRLVLLNTAAFHLPKEKKLPLSLWLVRNTAVGALSVRYFNAFSRGAAWVACTKKRMPRALREAYCAPYNSPQNRIATLRFVQDIPLKSGDPAYDLVSQTQQFLEAGTFQHIPTLICWGMKDFVFDHHFLTRWKKYLPQAEVHQFPESGHYVLEDSSDEIIPLIQQFLKNHP
ncbi:MAG: alpha/beta fold hydrolase [Anaerolineae bacterium]|nr:alpha/beta fold hydrolase [Anaerolineae bacterium]